MKKMISRCLMILSLFFAFTSSLFAADYAFCKKWALDVLAVVCNPKPNAKSQNVGTKLTFKKLQENNWKYSSVNQKYPFEILLTGPGLLGPTVTDQGREACHQFCKVYQPL